MIKFSKILLLAISTAVLSWFLPWLYALLTPSPSADPFCAFSPVSGEWIVSRSTTGEKPVIRQVAPYSTNPEEGRQITVSQRDSLVPQLYYRQLLSHDLLPDTIAGKKVSPHTLKTHELFFNGSPRDINKKVAGVWLMMESMPARVDLTNPEEAFRFTPCGIEFLGIADNKINADRSRRFTEAMKSKGFSFPATDLSGNPTSKKPYDEGYLMIDSDGKVFHVKQQAGRPYVSRIILPDDVTASKVFIWEESDRSLLGMAVADDGTPFLIRADGHQAIPLRGENVKVDCRTESLMAMGSLFNFVLRLSGKEVTRWRAFDAATLAPIGAIDFPKVKPLSSRVSRYVFPYTLAFTSAYDSLAYPRIANISARALPLNIALSLTLLLIGIRRKDTTMKWGALATIPLGIFSFFPFLLLHD